VQSSRVVLGADFDHVAASGARFEFAPWFMWTDFRSRQNFTGDLESSQIDPTLSGLGDLFEMTNVETAAGLTSRFHTAPVPVAGFAQISAEPGVTLRVGQTEQTKSLLAPSDLEAWDRRVDAGLQTLDAGAYLDLDLRLFRRLRISGGPRADLLVVGIHDRLANVVPAGTAPPGALPEARRDVEGVAAGPRVTVAYDLSPELTPVASYGEGFRSLDAQTLAEGAVPYSKIRSVEVGFRAQTPKERYATTLALFETWVANELVFEAAAGGFETENASIRRGIVGSFVARPVDWLLASAALSVTEATFSTLAEGVGHHVPSVPPVLFRADVTARGRIATMGGRPISGRVGVGYTFLSGRHLTDTVLGPTSQVLNAKAALRYASIELGIDGYNVLDLRYADDAQVYVSNWSLRPGQQRASVATHLTAAPPLTLLATAALYF
jgi:outer membrane receptor protein involved in Fe transport